MDSDRDTTPSPAEPLQDGYEKKASELHLTTASQERFLKFRLAVRDKRWTTCDELLAEISASEPDNISFLIFRAGFVNYNLSAMHDTPDECYHWRRQAILLLIDGCRANPDSSQLPYETAYLIGALSEAVKREEFRRLFGEDSELHARCSDCVDLKVAKGPSGQPECALVARLFALSAIEIADRTGIYGESPPQLLLFVAPAEYQARYAELLAREGQFGRALAAWKATRLLLEELAQREFLLNDDWKGRMADLPEWQAKNRDLWRQFDATCPGLRQGLLDEAMKNKPLELQQYILKDAQVEPWAPEFKDIERVTRATNTSALAIARQAIDCGRKIDDIRRSRVIVQLDERLQRCEIEQSSESIRARGLLYQARSAHLSGRIDDDNPENPGAHQLYSSAFRQLANNLREHPDWSENYLYWDDIVYQVRFGQQLLGTIDVPPELAMLCQKWAP